MTRRSTSSAWRRRPNLPDAGFYDEAYEDGGEPRPHYRAALEALAQHDLSELGERLRAHTLEREVRYGATGPDKFVIDAVPRMFTAQEWETLDRGLAQRVRALDAFLRDAYGERRIVEAGVVPARLIEDGAFYEPDMQGVDVPVWVGFAGLDVVRGADGEFNVLEDNVRMPTGLGFAPLAWEAVAELLDGALPDRSPARRRVRRALRRHPARRGARRPRRPVDRRARRRLRERRAVGDLRRRVPPRGPDGRRSTTCARARAASTPTSTAAGATSTSSTAARTTTCCATRTARRARWPRSCSSRSGAAR